MKILIISITFLLQFLLINDIYAASDMNGPSSLDMISSPLVIFPILIFILAYMFVMAE